MGDDDETPNGKHLDEKLDEALADTFPASDPIELTPTPEDEAEQDEAEDDV